MDDGSKQGKGFHLNTHHYILEQVEILSKAQGGGLLPPVLDPGLKFIK